MQPPPQIQAFIVRLEAVRKRADLLALIPRVAAAGFGLLPLEAGDGWLEVAASPRVAPTALAALERILGRSLRVIPVPEGLVHVYLGKLYPRQPPINFETFPDEGFLERPEEAQRLLCEKPYEPVAPVVRPDPERLILLDYAYATHLWHLDGVAAGPTFRAGDTDLLFDVDPEDPERAVVQGEAPVPRAVHLLVRCSYEGHGGEHEHGWKGHQVRRLPFMIHPTELQVTGVRADGTLDLLVYDDEVQVHPGETPRFEVTYCYLSMGQRLRRRLQLEIRGLWSFPRGRVRVQPDPLPWRPEHLARWIGQAPAPAPP